MIIKRERYLNKINHRNEMCSSYQFMGSLDT